MAKRGVKRGVGLDFDAARTKLADRFAAIEQAYLSKEPVPSANTEEISHDISALFNSATQAYREGLLGCIIARLQCPHANIRLPYVKHGENAFNGRALDEGAVNPFLRSNRIPCSTGPYLSSFRRGIKFEPGTAIGLRDQDAFSAFLRVIDWIEAGTADELNQLLDYLLFRFVVLREQSIVAVSRVARLSTAHLDAVVAGFMAIKSGGLTPVLIAVAMLKAISRTFSIAEREHDAMRDAEVGRDASREELLEFHERIVGLNRGKGHRLHTQHPRFVVVAHDKAARRHPWYAG